MRIFKGPLPPSVLHGPTEANASQGEQPGERVKRKCGRPRNPIPRHKRDSHIMAEHRRRGKIQECFQVLKTMVPRYTVDSGRNSKSNVLVNAVDHCKFLQREIQCLGSGVEELRAELAHLNKDIGEYQAAELDERTVDSSQTAGLDQHFHSYVRGQSETGWGWATNTIFLRIASHLFESYKQSVGGRSSVSSFALSAAKWAVGTFTVSNLHTAYTTAVESDVDGQSTATLTVSALEGSHNPQNLKNASLTSNKAQQSSESSEHQAHNPSPFHHHDEGADSAHNPDIHSSCNHHGHHTTTVGAETEGRDRESLTTNSYYPSEEYSLASGGCSAHCFSSVSEDPGSSPKCCLVGQCSLEEMTRREFFSFTRQDAHNTLAGDADHIHNSFPSVPTDSKGLDRRRRVDDSRKTFLVLSSHSDKNEISRSFDTTNLNEDLEDSEHVSIRDQQTNYHSSVRWSSNLDKAGSFPFSPVNSLSSCTRKRPPQSSHGSDKSHPPRPSSVSHDGIMSGYELSEKPRPCSSNASPAFSTWLHDTKVEKASDMYSNKFVFLQKSSPVGSAPSSPGRDRSYMSFLPSTLWHEKAPSSSAGYEFTDTSSPQSYGNLEGLNEEGTSSRLRHNPLGSRSYLAQLLQAPLPSLESFQTDLRSPLREPTSTASSSTRTGTVRHTAGLHMASQTFSREKLSRSLNTHNHPESSNRPENFGQASNSRCGTELEQQDFATFTPNVINIKSNRDLAQTSESSELEDGSEHHCSDAECLSATCDLYVNAQGVVDMTAETLKHACHDKEHYSFSHHPTYKLRKIRLSPAENSSNTAEVKDKDSPDSSAHTSTAPHLQSLYPPSGPDIQAVELDQVSSVNHNSNLHLATETPSSLGSTLNSSSITRAHPTSPQTNQHENNCSNTQVSESVDRSKSSQAQNKCVSAPVLKQRYLSQTFAKATQESETLAEPLIPAQSQDKQELANGLSSLKRPLCQPDYTHKWKMRRLVLSSGY